MDRISQLPQEILQRILYLLTQEEAARTSVLSKAWRYLWCTRRNVSFDQVSFNGDEAMSFLSVLGRTIQRYHDQKLSIEEFHVKALLSPHSDSVSLIKKWIPIIILNMDVKNLHIDNDYIKNGRPSYRLPHDVFKAKFLQDLRLRRCIFRKRAPDKVMFQNLKKLQLIEVIIHEDTFQSIISNCPLIESMHLERCDGLIRTFKVDKLHNLKGFVFINRLPSHSLNVPVIIDIPITLETINIDDKANPFRQPDLKILSVSRVGLFGKLFSNLKNISLNNLELSSKTFENFSSNNFPSLEELSLIDCFGFDKFQLLSDSMKYFILKTDVEGVEESIKFCIDVNAPNLIYFEFSGILPESISLKTSSSEWESDVSASFLRGFKDTSSWFLKLYEMLEALNQSAISLRICYFEHFPDQHIEDPLPIDKGSNSGHYKPAVVEELCLYPGHSSSFPAFLNGLFCICHPSNIVVYVHEWDTEQKEVFEILSKSLINIGRESGKKEELRHHQFDWQQDLEEVSMDTFDKHKEEWHPLQYDTLSFDLSKWRERYRFELKWREASRSSDM